MSAISASVCGPSKRGNSVRADHLIGLALCVAYVAALVATSFDSWVFARRGFYFSASST